MTKKRKIILISLAVTLALAVGVGGFVYAENNINHYHTDVGGNKLLGVGEMGWAYQELYGVGPLLQQEQLWDTQFIITNPNCEKELTIEWVALIASEDVYERFDGDGPMWYAEDIIFEGTPQDWYSYTFGYIDIPGNENSELGVLSPHEVWQVSIAELITGVVGDPPPEWFIDNLELGKYTLEVTWSGARYTGWWWWGYWRSGRPLTGLAKEKCWSIFTIPDDGPMGLPGFAISEAEMKVFPSRRPFKLPEIPNQGS